MYLSRLLLNPRSPEARRDLGNVHAMHQRLLSAFPDANLANRARKEYGALYRVDTSHDQVSVLLQANVQPDWSRIPLGYLLQTFEPNPGMTDLANLLATIRGGARFRFRLRANPTKRLSEKEGAKRGKRIELVGSERLLAWLLRKAEGCGFAVNRREDLAQSGIDSYRVRIVGEPKVRGRREGAALAFGSALFDGELVVTDPAAFVAALKNGVGSAKAYGFGLLSVAPV